MIEEKPCPHFSELSNREVFNIMAAANEEAKLEEYYPNPTIAQQEFYDNLMYIQEQAPHVEFDVRGIELDDEESEEWSNLMFDDEFEAIYNAH